MSEVTTMHGTVGQPMTPELRARFDGEGVVVIPAVLGTDEVAHYTSIVDELHERRRVPAS